MRSILFFDLPVETAKQRKAYRDFIKTLKSHGFFMIQKLVYSKMSINDQTAQATVSSIKKKIPNEGAISILTITEKQFASIQYLLGKYETEFLESDARFIEL